MLSIVILNVIMHSTFMLSSRYAEFFTLGFVMLSVIMANVGVLNVAAPLEEFEVCWMFFFI
jgi:hypothetical protein